MSDKSEWICIKSFGNYWCSETVYIDPEHETAKVVHYKITYWGHHDEYDDEEYDKPISIERALELVWPDEEAVSRIIRSTKKDYSKTLAHLTLKNPGNAKDPDFLPSGY